MRIRQIRRLMEKDKSREAATDGVVERVWHRGVCLRETYSGIQEVTAEVFIASVMDIL